MSSLRTRKSELGKWPIRELNSTLRLRRYTIAPNSRLKAQMPTLTTPLKNPGSLSS